MNFSQEAILVLRTGWKDSESQIIHEDLQERVDGILPSNHF
jgi:hypothetical protein